MEPKQVFGTPSTQLIEGRRQVKFCPLCGSTCEERRDHHDIARSVCTACGTVHYVNALPGVSVLVHREEEVLLVRRSSGQFQCGLWCMPCGVVEYDEDFLTAGLREVKEETGLDVRITGLISACTNFFEAGTVTLVVVVLAEPIGGVLEAPDAHEVSEVRWFRHDVLPALAFEADAHIIERYFATRLEGVPVEAAFAQVVAADRA